MTNSTQQKKAYAYALLAVGFWSTAATAFKLTLDHCGPEPMVFYASGTSILVLALILFFQNKLSLFRSLKWSDFTLSLVLGGLNPFLYYLILIRAYDLLRAQEAQAINYTWAITMTLLSIPLLKQKLQRLQLLAIALSYFGALIIATGGNLTDLSITNPWGFILAMGSTILWSLFWILGVKDSLDPVLRLFLNFCCGMVYTGLWSYTQGISLVPNFWGLGGSIYLGVLEMGLSFVLWITALRLSRTTAQISNLIYLAPFLSLIFIHIFVGETILGSTIIGLFFILAGTAVQRINDHRQTKIMDQSMPN